MVISKVKRLIVLSLCSFGLSAAVLNIIPYALKTDSNELSIVAIIAAAVFWAGIVIAFILVKSTNVALKKADGISRKNTKAGCQQRLPGIVSFSLTIKHIVMYLLILAGLLLIVFDIFFGFISEYIMFPIISITFFLFTVHCIIDGKSFKIYKLLLNEKRNGYERKENTD